MIRSYPDPGATASIYCSGRLDEVLQRVILPLRESPLNGADEDGYLWVLRYGKGGEHLKVRLHGPEELLARQRESLERLSEAYLAELDEPVEPRTSRPSWATMPAIDEEDRIGTEHPDRTFLWTRYQRSHVSLGGGPLLKDDRYVAAITRCLGRGCDLVLESLGATEVDGTGRLPDRVRQLTLVKTAILGLAAADLTVEDRRGYLRYHRDWMLRFPLLKANAGPAKAEEMLERLRAQVARKGAFIEALRAAEDEHWHPSPEAPIPGDGTTLEDRKSSWQQAVSELVAYVASYRGDPGHQVDPFVDDPVFPALFKVLHGVGNQLGLGMVDEAQIYHFLLVADAGLEVQELPIRLEPDG